MRSTFKNTVMYAFAGFCVVLLFLLVMVNSKIRADSQALLHESIKSQLRAICSAALECLDQDAIAAYDLNPAQLEDPVYQAAIKRLRALAEHSGAKYIYILKMYGDNCHFVFDTDPDGDFFATYDIYPVHREAFAGRESAGVMNVVDEYGSFHTAAVPIRRDGKIIAVLSVDIEDALIRQEVAANRFNTLLLATTLAVVMFGMGYILFRLTRRLKAMQDKLTLMAHYDPVTGLPNRQYLIDHLESLLAKGDKTPYALFFTDLDNFKTVNDKAGHDAGDALLKRIGSYLGEAVGPAGAGSQVFRPSAGRLNVTARIGGDEFVMLIPGVERREDAARIAKTIIETFHKTVIDEHIPKYKVGLSIGAALYPGQSEDYHVILKYADIAMYHAKRAGKNDFRIYEDEMPEKREK